MPEFQSLIKKELKYEGLIDVREFYNLVEDWIKEKGYDRKERLNEQIVTEDHKQVRIEFEPWKKTSDYAKNVLKIECLFSNLKDVTVEVEGVKRKMQKGHAHINIEGFIETDYEGRLQNKPFYFFIREVFDRFFYKLYTDQAQGLLLNDANHIWLVLRRYFNMQLE